MTGVFPDGHRDDLLSPRFVYHFQTPGEPFPRAPSASPLKLFESGAAVLNYSIGHGLPVTWRTWKGLELTSEMNPSPLFSIAILWAFSEDTHVAKPHFYFILGL